MRHIFHYTSFFQNQGLKYQHIFYSSNLHCHQMAQQRLEVVVIKYFTLALLHHHLLVKGLQVYLLLVPQFYYLFQKLKYHLNPKIIYQQQQIKIVILLLCYLTTQSRFYQFMAQIQVQFQQYPYFLYIKIFNLLQH